MPIRQIILDTETTGLDPNTGHRLIEIGCVELVDRKLTGNHFHYYLNPDREVPAEAIEVHGITNEFLVDKPRFHEIVDDFMQYAKGAEWIIHNAPFDVGFLNHELTLLRRNDWGKVTDHCTVFDTLKFARKRHPGQRNSLDALCKRYGVDNSNRTLHGALLDSEILAEVYLAMTGGQTSLFADGNDDPTQQATAQADNVMPDRPIIDLPVIHANESELAAHHKFEEMMHN